MTEIALRNGSMGSLESWLREAEAASGIARALVGTAFVPDGLMARDEHNRPDYDRTLQQVAAVILKGRELGLDPMASLSAMTIIKGTPCLYALTLRALLQSHGHQIWVVEQTPHRAIVRGRRGGVIGAEEQESRWDTDRAKKAIATYGRPDSPWQKQPQNMLVARATAECCRLVAADALLGLPYVYEELQDITDPEPAAAETPSPRAAPAPVKRTARRASAPQPGSVKPPPDTTGDPADGGDAAGGVDGAPPATSPMITDPQRKALYAGLRDLGLGEKDAGLRQISLWIGRAIDSTKDLTEDEASSALIYMTAAQLRQEAATDPSSDPVQDTLDDQQD